MVFGSIELADLQIRTDCSVFMFCSLYVAGLSLFAVDYIDNFTKPALDQISADPASLTAVSSPKRGVALALVLIAPWPLLLISLLLCYALFIIRKKYFARFK